ncbi:MAG: hypothetical protein RL748_426 [Pseudomonadota bacterium]|jgi:hypothetical protein
MHTIITKSFVMPLAFLVGNALAASDAETRLLAPGVKKIEQSSNFAVTIKHSKSPSIVISGDKAQFGKVEFKQSGDTLKISQTPGIYSENNKLAIEINLPEVNEVSLNSSGSGKIEGFHGNELKLTLAASGSANVDAQFRQASVVVAGSGSLNANLHSLESLKLSMTGSGSTTLQAQPQSSKIVLTGSGSLNASDFKAKEAQITLTGSGSANLSGEAASATITLSGSGSLIAPQWLTGNLVLNITGSGSARVFARDNADVIVKGQGSATILGNPTTRNAVARVGRVHWE